MKKIILFGFVILLLIGVVIAGDTILKIIPLDPNVGQIATDNKISLDNWYSNITSIDDKSSKICVYQKNEKGEIINKNPFFNCAVTINDNIDYMIQEMIKRELIRENNLISQNNSKSPKIIVSEESQIQLDTKATAISSKPILIK